MEFGGNTIHVFIKNPYNESKSFMVQIETSDTIGDLKDIIERKSEDAVPKNKQKLIYFGRICSSDEAQISSVIDEVHEVHTFILVSDAQRTTTPKLNSNDSNQQQNEPTEPTDNSNDSEQVPEEPQIQEIQYLDYNEEIARLAERFCVDLDDSYKMDSHLQAPVLREVIPEAPATEAEEGEARVHRFQININLGFIWRTFISAFIIFMICGKSWTQSLIALALIYVIPLVRRYASVPSFRGMFHRDGFVCGFLSMTYAFVASLSPTWRPPPRPTVMSDDNNNNDVPSEENNGEEEVVNEATPVETTTEPTEATGNIDESETLSDADNNNDSKVDEFDNIGVPSLSKSATTIGNPTTPAEAAEFPKQQQQQQQQANEAPRATPQLMKSVSEPPLRPFMRRSNSNPFDYAKLSTPKKMPETNLISTATPLDLNENDEVVEESKETDNDQNNNNNNKELIEKSLSEMALTPIPEIVNEGDVVEEVSNEEEAGTSEVLRV
eukprot:TRINITY_DN144_c0_g1_i1.p1 TRINITY_DN144_c0_g1~~TRINITY_DN144_c0_g1_i1.p1  ORF type:complete len:496 (-),score=181.56 TRINITY_DN144_c0_g1_i1:196-1683(-)